MKKLMLMAAVALCACAWGEIRALTPATQEGQRTEKFLKRHEAKLQLVKAGGSPVVFIGDSITHFWETKGKEVWERHFAGEPYRALDLGTSADRTEHVLWRIANGELDGYEAKAVVLMIGTNNTGHFSEKEETPADTIVGVRAVIRAIQAKQPSAKIILHPIFPRGATPADPRRVRNCVVNAELRKLADGDRVWWCDFTDKLLEHDGTLSKDMMPDFLHPGPAGYEIWAKAVKPFIDAALAGQPAPKATPNRWSFPALPEKGTPKTVVPATRMMETGGRGSRPAGWWADRLLEKRREIAASDGTFDIVFFGDSITHFWERPAPRNAGDVYTDLRKQYKILDIGYGGDRTQHLVWRGLNGELTGYEAKLVMLMIGTNNRDKPEEIAAGVKRVIEVIQEKQPKAKTLLLPIFPRGESAQDPNRVRNEKVNALIKPFADGDRVLWCDFNAKLVDEKGDTLPFMQDRLHPNRAGYVIWRDAVLPYFRQVCGK